LAAKEPFGGPEEVLRYLSRYTHRVAISNRRLVSADDAGVTFKCKDYRIDGPGRYVPAASSSKSVTRFRSRSISNMRALSVLRFARRQS